MVCSMGGFLNGQQLKVTSGSLVSLPQFKSEFVDARQVSVWLPDDYNADKKYAVLYMQDGQMLFDAATTWNKQAWEVDVVAGQLIAERKTKPFIVVGIWNNNSKRHAEYFPEKAYQYLNETQKHKISQELLTRGKINVAFAPIADAYLKFIVTELKPYIDAHFATFQDLKHTFIAGSSMGGLISLYAICEYPKVFGGAACLSTHWTGIYRNYDNPIPDALLDYLKKNLPNSKRHKIYFDYGDQTLDSLYGRSQLRVDALMKAKGYSEKNWITKFYPRADHSESSWRKRLDVPLVFLLHL